MQLRKRFFDDSERYTMIAGSIHETDWFDRVRERGGPVFLLTEAVFLYFPGEQVRETPGRLASSFPSTGLAFDTGGRVTMNRQDRNPVFKALPARMQWICDEPRSLESLGLTLLESRTFASPPSRCGAIVARSLSLRGEGAAVRAPNGGHQLQDQPFRDGAPHFVNSETIFSAKSSIDAR
jgi:hypothetical protein